MKPGDAIQLGPYTVRCTMRADNPAFPNYTIMRGAVFIGRQFSMPQLSDAEWLENERGVYARESQWPDRSKERERGRDAYVRNVRLRRKELAGIEG